MVPQEKAKALILQGGAVPRIVIVGVATWATRYRTSSTELTFDTLSSGYAAVLDIVVDLMVRMETKAGKRYKIGRIDYLFGEVYITWNVGKVDRYFNFRYN